MNKAVIFDMDGLMFDSENLSYLCLNKILKEYNLEMPLSDFSKLMGTTEEETKNFILAYFDFKKLNLTYEEVMNKYHNLFITSINNNGMPMKKGLVELLDYLKTNKIKIAVASSSSLELINTYLSLNNLSSYIDEIVSGDEVVNCKPDPEVFLKACDKLQVSPNNAIVLEDSNRGLLAAQNANIKNIWIPDLGLVEEDTKKGIDAILNDLSEVITFLNK